MINRFEWRDRVKNLIERGCEVDAIMHIIDDDSAESAIMHLKFAAENDPGFLLKEMTALDGSKMIPIAIAILYSYATNEFLSNEDNKFKIIKIMLFKDPAQLLEMVEILKSKSFGKGFGARPQKMIRKIMESWDSSVLEEFITNQPKCMYSLVRIVHPRYVGYRGEIIKLLIRGELKIK